MEQQKVMNRWLVVIGAILIQLALGAIYAWSVFTPNWKASYGFCRSGSLDISPVYFFYGSLAGRKLLR
ncbi:MAG: hypothetical protein R2759_10855 [Bacteroidales bacterium]